MKLSDYVIEFLASQGIKHNFLVSGGAVIHLVDSTAKHPRMDYICGQHEEHSAAAADMYSRVTGNPGLVMTTSGPGATNIVTSVANAFYDSIPMLCITGQVARFRIRKSKKLRQRGFQEIDTVSIFQSITKYCALVLNPEDIRYELEKAVYFAKEGRPGPSLLDIPDDLQRVDIDPQTLQGFHPPKKLKPNIAHEVKALGQMVLRAKKPVLIFGAGIQYAKAAKEALQFAESLNVPVVCTWGGADVIPHLHPLNMGCIGICGPRAGNFAIQNSDLVIALGTRLSPNVTGGKQNLFAPHAKKVMVDIDPEELAKFDADTFILDLPICADLKDFFQEFAATQSSIPGVTQKLAARVRQSPGIEIGGGGDCIEFNTIPSPANSIAGAFTRPGSQFLNHSGYIHRNNYLSWRLLIRSWMPKYPICPPGFEDSGNRVQPHLFIKKLSSLSKEGDIIIGDTGANLSWALQAFETKRDQRIFSAWNQTPMGYSLPASVGAALASDREITCLIGDGGFMMCLQELATIRRHDLPVRIFLFNNAGHAIQKQTIDNWLNSHYAAVDEASGLYFPDYQKISEAFKIPYFVLKSNNDLKKLPHIFSQKGPLLCNVEIIESQKIVPMLKFGSGIEDLDPKIPKDELDLIVHECQNINQE